MSGRTSTTAEYPVGNGGTRVRFMNPEEALQEIPGDGETLFVFDTNTRPLVAGTFPNEIVLPAGERNKSWRSVDAILKAALRAGLGRDGVFVGCGGGVVTDITAFAASIYMRGCRVVLAPTTLLAMVDAAFGGKAGIDFEGYKNIVGSFYPAAELRIAVGFLTRLPSRDFRSGLAEVLKHSLLVRSALRSRLVERRDGVLARDLEILEEIVADALNVKAGIVEQDFLESGIRSHLNLGHTFGHALESVTGFHGYTHGEAVAWGIDKAMRTGVRLGVTDPDYGREVADLLRGYGFALENVPAKAPELLDAMRRDKKKQAGSVRFVLQRGWGDTFLTAVADEIILSVISD